MRIPLKIGSYAYNREEGAITERELYNSISVTPGSNSMVVYWATYVNGDINHDGQINDIDSRWLARYLATKEEDPTYTLSGRKSPAWAESLALESADVNHDGKVNSTDSILYEKYLAGLIAFPFY